MKRRRFSAQLVGLAATAWPSLSDAQQRPLPVIGWLYLGRPEANAPHLPAFRDGLAEAGFIEGRSVTVEYRWAEDQRDRLPALANDLVQRKVDVIVTIGPAPWEAKRATTTIPIVFGIGGDPVAIGFVNIALIINATFDTSSHAIVCANIASSASIVVRLVNDLIVVFLEKILC